MAFVVERDEPLAGGLVRVGRDLADSALAHLGRIDEDPEGAVHEARRNIRSLRAVLRLVRPLVGEEVYQRDKERLRSAGGILSPHRDADVQLAAFDRLAEGADGPERGDEPRWIRRLLAARVTKPETTPADAAAEAAGLLRQTRTALDAWGEGLGDEGQAVRGAAVHAAERARKRYKRARKDPSAEALHELRKRCKDIRDQLRILLPLDERALGKLEQRYDRVCDLLGEARDFRLLSESLGAVRCELPEAGACVEALRLSADERARELNKKGLKKAERAARKGPGKVAKALGAS